MSQFIYKAFGLIVSSEFEIPEFLPFSGEPDVFIKSGEVPSQLNSPQFVGVRFQASPNQFLLRVDQIATYHAENGKTITVKTNEGSIPSEVRLFLLGSAFGALLHQRGLLPMHGSSISIKGKAYIFSGVSGAGKSTLAAGLISRGYELLSDDISVVALSDSQHPIVYAGYPQMKLWADSMEKLGMKPECHPRVRSQLNKHQLQVEQSFYHEALPLGGIYILQSRNSDGILLESLKGIEKFNTLKNNTYRLNFIKGLGNTETHFRHISAVAMSCPVRRITRSSKGFSIEQLLDLIEQDIHGTSRS
jgi:hypothetical protein